ncbi:MAG TPA: ABC transporter permease, partial [Verrucomicrobiae bacterium]|nr:ABC transporter permease [Verrucomicrobiae bacterium]
FAPDEDQPGKDRVVVLAHGFWKRRFGGDAGIIGKNIQLNNQDYAVVGVLPSGFPLWQKGDFVIPRGFTGDDVNQRGTHWIQVFGRLKPGETIGAAQAELSAIAKRLRPLYPVYKKDWGVTLVPMHEEVTGQVKPTLLVLFCAVGCVLLIACCNVANLLLAKAASRQREMAVRAALGASRWRVIRQLLTESVLLSLAGAALGLLLAFWSVHAVKNLRGVNLPRVDEVGLDLCVLGFTALVSLIAGAAFGLVPAMQTSRVNLNDMLKDGTRTVGVGSRNRVRGGLIVAEVALSLVLLIGAGLLLNSFVRLCNIPSGINSRNTLTAELTLPEKKYPNVERGTEFFLRLLERISALPGVEAAGLTGVRPVAGWSPDTTFTVIGRPQPAGPGMNTDFDFCTPDYFRAAGIPLRKGRFFDARDKVGSPRVVVVNETLARQHFPNQDPVGQRIHLEVFTGKIDEGWEIVGVVGDVRQHGLGEDVKPCVYRPRSYSFMGNDGNLVIRTTGSPLSLAAGVLQAIREIDSEQPVANVRTMEAALASSMAQRRFVLWLLGGFAGASLSLAAIGLYGVIAYAVSQRTREIGIRMALGASRGNVLALVLRGGMRLAGIGVIIGIAAAAGLTRLMRTLLYGIEATDTLTFVGVSGLLTGIAFLACWLPARRAARLSPLEALRAE